MAPTFALRLRIRQCGSRRGNAGARHCPYQASRGPQAPATPIALSKPTALATRACASALRDQPVVLTQEDVTYRQTDDYVKVNENVGLGNGF